jgi:hypothetical protein
MRIPTDLVYDGKATPSEKPPLLAEYRARKARLVAGEAPRDAWDYRIYADLRAEPMGKEYLAQRAAEDRERRENLIRVLGDLKRELEGP